jgi:hypothetical protein
LVDEFLCVTVSSNAGETVEQFSTRLSTFWSAMLRESKERFEQVYAESIEWEQSDDRWQRQYLIEPEMEGFLTSQLQQAGFRMEPIDPHDKYSKYEAVPSEWMQIEH